MRHDSQGRTRLTSHITALLLQGPCLSRRPEPRAAQAHSLPDSYQDQSFNHRNCASWETPIMISNNKGRFQRRPRAMLRDLAPPCPVSRASDWPLGSSAAGISLKSRARHRELKPQPHCFFLFLTVRMGVWEKDITRRPPISSVRQWPRNFFTRFSLPTRRTPLHVEGPSKSC
ncbi:hypothetical protein B0J15DRAFT_224060 [Fusarium solani]|uniref:Uncharacterized protein n=1 Tax=Fusarium solani TaxID=169388 RepID=A0A9P9L070_FUSSL|nr:uncharacterized protein B0J15DRAFT_224060 [Fusarium solani]KAH7271798.1 hypothetical protein B0J15DRAFT_224060 [Fusarium solani]